MADAPGILETRNFDLTCRPSRARVSNGLDGTYSKKGVRNRVRNGAKG